MNHGKPRHIRDIAHLYLSRMRTPSHSQVRRSLLVAGASKECFSGFHVANLALSLSVQGHSLRLVDLSGLILNSAFFFAMPANIYAANIDARAPRDERAGWLSALGGVSLSMGVPAYAASPDQPGEKGLDVYHLPTLDSDEAFVTALTRITGELGRDAAPTLLCLRPGRWDEPPRRVLEGVAGRRYGLRVDNDEPGGASSFLDLGFIDRWTRFLPDPVPVIVRDPASRLSRSYMSVCERWAADHKGDSKEHAPSRIARPSRRGRAISAAASAEPR